MTFYQEQKQKIIDLLRWRYAAQHEQIEAIEPRLAEYYVGLCEHSGVELDDENDWHNASELMGAIRLLNRCRDYIVAAKQARRIMYKYEGEWRKNGKRWYHVRGGVTHPSDLSGGRTHYRLQPWQVFVLFSIFGLKCWVNTKNEAESRELRPTEAEFDGEIWDLRRLCTEFVLYTPRKTAKTQLSAFIQYIVFMEGDANAECYCCANASDQSKILFGRTKDLIKQLDPDEQRIRFTATQVNWKEGQFRTASLISLSAGGKTKDGTYAALCSADEFGSAGYVNGKSDMGRLVSVIESSMAPRREPLTFISTTAGTIKAGPFIDKLAVIEQGLEAEVFGSDGDTGDTGDRATSLLCDGTHTCPHVPKGALKSASDRRLCLLLQPDKWEREEEYLLSSVNVRRKINPMLGIVCQHSFYDDEVEKARENSEKKADVLAKDFNVYMSLNVEGWITADEVRRLQVPMRIDDCTADKGWAVFAGADFSKGDDLNTIGWLAVNLRTRMFFADADCWVSLKAAQASNVWELYEQWQQGGWLTIVPGETFDPAAVTRRVAELTKKGVNLWRIGYDPYNAAIVINALSSYIHDVLGREPEKYIMVVKQGFANYNPLVNEFDYMVHRCDQQGKPAPMISFSQNPMIPWQFGNVALGVSTDGYENKKPIKKNPGSEACKVDSIQAILSALKCYDVVDGGEVKDE